MIINVSDFPFHCEGVRIFMFPTVCMQYESLFLVKIYHTNCCQFKDYIRIYPVFYISE